ncbi:MAG TPA: GNAT family N-acetyltransferase [Polyangia bacterium]|nr:GNAT family N-acetyltransferase [Polyangia bacterium]
MRGAIVARRANSGDREALRSLDTRTASAPIEQLWVAHRDAKLVGFAVLVDHFFGRPFVELLVVAEDARRSGVGTALLAAIEDAIAGDRLFTSTNESNAPMRALLAKVGWILSGRIENLDAGDPELVFVKLLRR